MPQETKSKTPLAGDQPLQHHTADASDPAALRKAIELAVDYRGDVTITRASSGESVECFIFDVKQSDDPTEMRIRALQKDSDDRLTVALSDVASITFTGRDTAAGKSFDTWMRKYVAKKLAGETASIESESLD